MTKSDALNVLQKAASEARKAAASEEEIAEAVKPVPSKVVNPLKDESETTPKSPGEIALNLATPK